jgi:hypothetical protein
MIPKLNKERGPDDQKIYEIDHCSINLDYGGGMSIAATPEIADTPASPVVEAREENNEGCE